MIFDDDSGRNGNGEEFEDDGYEGEDRDDGSDETDDDGNDRDTDKDRDSKRRRNRPGARQRDAQRIRTLEGKLDSLISAIQSGGLAVNAPKDDGRRRSTKDDNGAAQAVDVDALRREIESEIIGQSHKAIVRSEAKAALQSAGFRGSASRGVGMLNLKGIEVRDGEVDEDALLDAIEDLKEDSPELFGRARRTRRDSGRDRDYGDDDDGYRPRESRATRSREQMSRREPSGDTRESDSLAANLLRAIGGQRPSR